MLTSLAVALSLTSVTSATPLTVPYLPQTDALCGGAAAAMVFRYWGDVHADVEQFAPIVDRRAGGIASDALVRAVEERGWLATRAVGSIDQLTEQLQHGHPIVILLAAGGPVYHYVVVTGIEADAVVVHDPTWGPSRRIPVADLIRAWRPANFWSLVIEPSGPRIAGDRPAPETFEVLGPVSELAGVRFTERRWREASELAERAIRLDPADRYAWEILAASRFIQDDPAGALRAWNRLGRPRINLVDIDGLVHTRFQTVAAAIGLRPNMLLTARAFGLAERRLQDLPDRATARLTLRPEPDGFATVKAVVVERSGPPRTAVAWTVAGVQAAIDREARLTIPGTTGQGEVWSASWRWWNDRPRFVLGFAAPHVGHLPGVWRVETSWESQTYRFDPAAGVGASLDESRAHGALTLGGWLAPNVRYSASAGIDSWSGATPAGRTFFAGGSIERRWLDDRWSLGATATSWAGAPGRAAFHEAAAHVTFRSSPLTEGWIYLADAGIHRVTDSAPLGLWPGAGDGHAREPLLRAHPLLSGGAIALTGGAAFGKTLVESHAEAQRWIASASPIRIGIATFSDLARASRRRAPANGGIAQIDVGTGVRVRLPGAAGTLRVDAAHGIRDGADAVTFGWQY